MPCGFKIPFGHHRVDRINLANAVKQLFLVIVSECTHRCFINLRSHGAWGESQVAMMRTVLSAGRLDVQSHVFMHCHSSAPCGFKMCMCTYGS